MYRFGLLFMLVATVRAGKHDMYRGHSVHGVKLRDVSDQTIVNGLRQSYNADIWTYGYPGERDTALMLSPENRDGVLKELDLSGITHYLKVPDFVEALETHDKQLDEWKNTKRRSNAVPFDDYPSYDEINAYMEKIAAEYPELVTIVTAGQSFERRAVKYLKISTTKFQDSSKPIYFMDAMLHAREWVTTPVALYSIHRLVEDLREQDKDLLEDIDWIIHPLVNPDGYEYSRNTDRMWRRTRSFNPAVSTICYGVDGNRNFDVAWNTTRGVSSDPCNDEYTGTEPFSEPETRIVRDILLEHVERMEVYLNMHSHGNYVLFGYGNTTLPSYPANPVHLFHVSSAMGAVMDAMKLPAADYYKVGNAGILYETSGCADDYGLKVGVPLSLCLELPGYTYDFLVPPRYIQQINQETWEGIAASARIARSHYRARNN